MKTLIAVLILSTGCTAQQAALFGQGFAASSRSSRPQRVKVTERPYGCGYTGANGGCYDVQG